MRAIEQRGYGEPRDVLHLAEVPVPELSAEQVLVRVRAASANPADWHLICGEPMVMRPALGGIRGPRRVVGGDFAGVIEQLGSSVTAWAVGDEVYGCSRGTFAEFVAAPTSQLARKPQNLDFEQAAAVPLAAITALQGLRLGGLSAGQHVLVIGASGGIGTFAVQLAKHAGAEVTGVASTGRLDFVRGLGADHVIDYTLHDPAAGAARYDLVLQLAGTGRPRALHRILTPTGNLVMSTGDGGRWFGPLGLVASGGLLGAVGRRRVKVLATKESSESLDELRELIEAGHIRPVVDSLYPLERAGEALALVREGRPAGKVVVTVAA